jgi:virulence factor Mce-like protein
VRRLAAILAVCALLASALTVRVAGADDAHTYRVELSNAFGLTPGSNVRIAGVDAGVVGDVEVNEAKRAEVEIEVSGPLAQFHADATCSSEPQSLIAEYFLDCQPGRAEELLADGALIPLARTTETVQTDIAFNTLREPFRQRLALIINEFGTGLAGNPERLNAAIRRGVPALRELHRTLRLLSAERRTIRDLASDAERILSRLAGRREDVRSFIVNAREAAEATAARRSELARDLELLPGFLAELQPSMDRLRVLAGAGAPTLAHLRRSADELTTLTAALPAFAEAGVPAVEALGDAAEVGRPAILRSADEVRALRAAGRRLPRLAGNLAGFVRDLDDPDRATEVDSEAAELSGRPAPTGYTGFEGLANLAYFLTNASSQFDQIGHLTQFSPIGLLTNPCSLYNAGPTVPSEESTGIPPYGEYVPTRDPDEIHPCVMWLGPRQPGINAHRPALPPYDPSVCPDGSTDLTLCDPNGAPAARVEPDRRPVQVRPPDGGEAPASPPSAAGTPGAGPLPDVPLPELPQLPTVPDTGLPPDPAGGLLQALGLDGGRGPRGGGLPLPRAGRASRDLLHYLLGS